MERAMLVQIYNPTFRFDYKLPTLQDYEYDLKVFTKFVNELVKLTSRTKTFMTEFLNHVYSSDWSYNYYLLKNLLSFRELVDLINNRIELFDEIIAEKDAIYDLSIISQTEKYQTLGINVKKIYKRVQLPNNNFQFNIAKAKEAKANYKSRSGLDISRNGGRLPVIGTIFKMCRTDKCETLEELRTTFFEEVERLVAYVQLYDIQTKNSFHSMMLFLAEQYKTNKIFTGVFNSQYGYTKFLEGKLVNFIRLKAFITSVKNNSRRIPEYILNKWAEYNETKSDVAKEELLNNLVTYITSEFSGGKRKTRRKIRNKKSFWQLSSKRNQRHNHKSFYKVSIKNGRKRRKKGILRHRN